MTPSEYEMIEKISERAAENACLKAMQPLVLQLQSLNQNVQTLMSTPTPFQPHPILPRDGGAYAPTASAVEKKTLITRLWNRAKGRTMDYLIFAGLFLIYHALTHGAHIPPPSP